MHKVGSGSKRKGKATPKEASRSSVDAAACLRCLRLGSRIPGVIQATSSLHRLEGSAGLACHCSNAMRVAIFISHFPLYGIAAGHSTLGTE
jgi:hypothetical protein